MTLIMPPLAYSQILALVCVGIKTEILLVINNNNFVLAVVFLVTNNILILPLIDNKWYMISIYRQEGQHPLTGQRAPTISGGT